MNNGLKLAAKRLFAQAADLYEKLVAMPHKGELERFCSGEPFGQERLAHSNPK